MWMSWQAALQLAAALLALLCVAHLFDIRLRAAERSRDLVAEVTRVLLLYALWQFTRERTVTRTAGAMDAARRLWRVERLLHFPSELSLQRAFMPHSWLMTLMNGYYAVAHVPVMGAVLVWLYCRHRVRYPAVRNVLALTTMMSVLLHSLPLAPPRMLTDLGFVDSAREMGQSVYGPGGTGASNQLAAMPSLHYAWATIAVVAVAHVGRSRWRWLIVLHLVLTALAVTATANHWWLDGVAAVVVVLVATALQMAGATAVAAHRRSHQRDVALAASGTRFVESIPADREGSAQRGLALDEVGHPRNGERDESVLGRVDETLRHQVRASGTERRGLLVEALGQLAGGARSVAVDGHRREVVALCRRGSFPARTEEATVEPLTSEANAFARVVDGDR